MTKEYAEICVSKLRSKLMLEDSPEDVRTACSEDGDWFPVVTRAGHRKVVAAQADYERHIISPIYEDSKYTLTPDAFTVCFRGAGKIVGAVGFLYKKGIPGYFMHHVDNIDYRGYGKAHTSMPVLMTMKVCEVGLFRIAYPLLFANTYSEDEYPTTPKAEAEDVLTREDKIRYVRENIGVSGEYIKKGRVNIENYSEPDLDRLYKKVKEVVDESKAEN